MNFRSLNLHINEAVSNIFRNKLMSFASIVTIISCLFMLNVSYIISANLKLNLEKIQSSNGISVFFEDYLTEDDILEYKPKFENIEVVREVEFISSEDAMRSMFSEEELEIYKNDYFLPASYVIYLNNDNIKEKFVKDLKEIEGISEIQHDTDLTKSLITINSIIQMVSYIYIGALVFISLVLIMNTIKLGIHMRKSEISVMKYIGATDSFVKSPFIIEGFLMGMTGAVIPVIIVFLLYKYMIGYLGASTILGVFVFIDPTMILKSIAIISFVIGITIGIVGSNISIRKYLRV